MFKKLFGAKDGRSAPPVQANAAAANKTIESIQNLSDQENQLEKRKDLLQKRIDGELDRAREFSKQQKKPQALQCLKKKKLLENEMNNLDNMIMRVIEQRTMLEGQRTTVEVVATMHSAALTAKENMKATKIENVDQVLDDISDMTSQMQQINDAFSNPTGVGADLDEDELLNELGELEAIEVEKELMQPAAVPANRAQAQPSQMPSVPAAKQKQPAKTAEELELEQLQAEMAL